MPRRWRKRDACGSDCSGRCARAGGERVRREIWDAKVGTERPGEYRPTIPAMRVSLGLVEEAIDVAIPVAERLAPAVGRALYARYAGLAALVTGTYGLAGVGIYVAAQRLAAQQTSLANVTPGDCPNQGGEPIYHWRNKTWRGSGFKGEHFIQRIYQTTGTNPEGFQQDYLDDGRSQYIGKGDIAPRQMWRILPAEGPTVRMSVDPTITNASGTMVNGTLMTVLPNQR